MRIYPPSIIYLYRPEKEENFDIDDVCNYVRKKFKKMKVVVRENFFKFHGKDFDKIAERMAGIRIRNANRKNSFMKPLPVEIEYEKRLLGGKGKFGAVYDGIKLNIMCFELISREEMTWEHCHILLTNRLIATWGGDRYHLRISVYSYPSIISLSGIVEAPAKPREFYLKLQAGMDAGILKKEFEGEFIDYGDERITEIAKGYVMQAVFFHATGYPFCDNRNCRLFNAHWQKDMIHAQLKGNELCPFHEKVLEEINGGKNEEV